MGVSNNGVFGTIGYTIVDSAILFNRTVYLVADDPASLPPIESIISTRRNSWESNWEILSSEKAKETLGEYGGKYVFSSYDEALPAGLGPRLITHELHLFFVQDWWCDMDLS